MVCWNCAYIAKLIIILQSCWTDGVAIKRFHYNFFFFSLMEKSLRWNCFHICFSCWLTSENIGIETHNHYYTQYLNLQKRRPQTMWCPNPLRKLRNCILKNQNGNVHALCLTCRILLKWRFNVEQVETQGIMAQR